MHAQPGLGTRAGAPVEADADLRKSEATAAVTSVPEPPDPSAAEYGYLPATSFRSRRSTLSGAQRETWERRWPQLGRSEIPEAFIPLDTGEWFGRRAPLVLEIGCGSGTSTLAMAQTEPDIDVIAVEVYRRGLAQLLASIDREQVSNIRLIRGNGIEVLRHLIAPASLTGVRVFFPDPWPKARHHKRRFLQTATVGLIADRLLPGGVLHAATDHAGYAEQIAEVGDAEARLCRVDADSPLAISVARPTTKYESKAHDTGSSVTELIWKRR